MVMAEHLPTYGYEHIFCDNASTDGTQKLLRQVAAADPNVKVIINARNVGPLRNIAHGVQNTSGDVVIPMVPADLQDPPELIPEMLSRMSPDVDVVFGVRTNRQENFLLRLARSFYYAIIKFSGDKSLPPSHAGEFLLARRSIIDAISPALSSYPYVRALVAKVTDRTAVVEYQWGVRVHGKSKNSLISLIDQAFSGFITTAKTPIRFALFFGIIMSIVGMMTGIVNIAIFWFGGAVAEPGVPTLIVGMFLFGGIQLFFIGLIGEYVVNIQSEVSRIPKMVEAERINFSPGI